MAGIEGPQLPQQQGNLDFGQRHFTDYTSEERMALVAAISRSRANSIPLNKEQQRFIIWSDSLGNDSQPSY